MNLRLQPGKSEYTETEAADALGVSAAQLRTLLERHVVNETESLTNVPLMRFRPSDLLMLSMLSGEKVPAGGGGGSPGGSPGN